MIRDRRQELRDLSVERCCQILSLSRSEYYARPVQVEAKADELLEAVRDAADVRPAYGYRRIGAALRKRGNRRATDKRVRRRMKQLGLNRRRRRRKARTTVPGKGPASPNLTEGLNLTDPRRLVVTDLTYVAIPGGFGYVSVLLDAFSRRALGWAVSDSLSSELPLEALEMAISGGDLNEGWIHHSDRGCQYTSHDYRQRVLDAKGFLSNSKTACPYDNARMESFFKTYKYEEANLQSFDSIEEIKENLTTFLEDYNHDRIHSAIGYCSPVEFETLHAQNNRKVCVR